MDGSDDGQAVEQARAGDPEAFRGLVERHSRSLFRLAYRMTRNEHDAEDVVQEAFLKAYRRLDQFGDRARFSSWLYRIAANCAYDLLRSRAREEPHRDAAGDGPDGPTELPAPDPSPDRVASGVELRRRVENVMGRMSPLERSAFALRHFEQLSIREIGEALGLDRSATKHSIFRAVRKLRRALESRPRVTG